MMLHLINTDPTVVDEDAAVNLVLARLAQLPPRVHRRIEGMIHELLFRTRAELERCLTTQYCALNGLSAPGNAYAAR
jgi:hypothetical protein